MVDFSNFLNLKKKGSATENVTGWALRQTAKLDLKLIIS